MAPGQTNAGTVRAMYVGVLRGLLLALLLLSGAGCGRQSERLEKVSDLGRLERAQRAKPTDRDAMVTLALGTGAVAIEIGQMERASRSVLNMGSQNAKLASTPKMAELLAKLRRQREDYLRQRGIRSERDLADLITRGVDIATQALARNDLVDDQRESLLVSRSRLRLLQSRAPEAEADAQAAIRQSAKSVPARLVLADALIEQERYREAITTLREASLLVDDWAQGSTRWTAMLYSRSQQARSLQAKRRRDIARAFHGLIATDISMLQAMERLPRR